MRNRRPQSPDQTGSRLARTVVVQAETPNMGRSRSFDLQHTHWEYPFLI